MQTARPSLGSDDHVKKMAVPSPVGDVKVVSSICTLVLKYELTQIKCVFYFTSKYLV